MRDTILTSLVLASASLASARSLECLQTRSRALAVAASCGDEGSLNYCFSHLPSSTQPEALSPELERCFVSAGCTTDESQIEAFWALKRCEAVANDLRRSRRQPEDGIALAKEPLVAARDPIAGPAAITAMRPRQDDAATTASPVTSDPSSPSPCFTDTETEFTTCPTQTTGADAGKKLSCYPTVTTTAKCREGLICQFDMQGNPSCMYKHSSLDLGGIIIAIVFASAIVVSVVGICFMCCRERREHRRMERAAEAARIAKESKTQATAAAKRPGANVTGGVGAGSASVEGQPLMYQGAGGDPQQQYYPPQGQMPMQQGGYAGANPFADSGHDAHPLH